MKTKQNKMIKPLILLVLLIAVFASVKIFDLTRYLSLEYIKSQIEVWQYQLETQKIYFIIAYFCVYVLVTALSIPGAAILTLLGGALFGLVLGSIVISFASTLGATISFLVSRFFLRDSLETKFSEQLKKVNKGIEKDGPLYLFALRLVPVFPFFLVNLLMGLTKIPTLVYIFVSQLGMFPGTVVYVNAGKALSSITSTSGIFSAKIWLSFAALAMLPFLSKKVISFIHRKKAFKNFKNKPSKFDTNLCVIGAGSGGLISAYIAATIKASVTLIEKDKMGGDCLNTGCVPSKSILAASKYAVASKKAEKFGIKYTKPVISFSKVMKGVHSSIAEVAPHDSVERYESLGVNCIKGEAKILSPWEVAVGDKIIKTKSIIIASGGRPRKVEVPNLDDKDVVNSDTVWKLTTAPKNLVVLGGGPIGCELAQAFARLGTHVTIVQRPEQVLHREDPEVGEEARKSLEESGVTVLTLHQAIEAKVKNKKKVLVVQNEKGKKSEIAYDKVLMAIGREANTADICGENVNIQLSADGTIETNEFLQTSIPNIYAVGDVVGPYQFTHIASHMAWYASVNALLGFLKSFAVDYSIVPSITFLDPEIARVGLSEREAKEQDIDYEVTVYHMEELDRAIAEQCTTGFIKVITAGKSDKILGATVVSERGGEILAQFVLAMKHKLGLNKILGTIFPYPSYSEAPKAIAGAWKKKHAPESALKIMQSFFKSSLR